MTHQANVIKSTVNVHILKQTIERGLKALGAAKVEFNQAVFQANLKASQLHPYFDAPMGRIEVWWPDNRKAVIQLDFYQVDHSLHIEDATGIQAYAKTIIRTLVSSRLEDSLKDFSVNIPISAL